MYDERFDSDDPYEGRTSWLRRPLVRGVVTAIAVGSFLMATLISSCGPRRTSPVPATTTTTTVPTIDVENPVPPPERLIANA